MHTFRSFISLNEAKISINDIHDGQGILDHDKVNHYRKQIQNNEKVKPVILVPLDKKRAKKLGKTHYIYDGSHRYHAHKQENKSHIEAIIADNESDAETHQMKQNDRR